MKSNAAIEIQQKFIGSTKKFPFKKANHFLLMFTSFTVLPGQYPGGSCLWEGS